jgi:hypothetical protein
MNKVLLIVGLLVLTATNANASIFTKKKSGRTCIVCKQQMAWTDGHLVELKNQLDADGKHKVVIVKTDTCVKELYANQDLYIKRKPSIWSFKHNKHGVSIKELFKN